MDKDTECRNCGFEFNFSESVDGFCPKCNSNQIIRRVYLYDEIKLHETLKLAKHDKNFSKNKNPRQEIITGEDFFKKSGKWIKKDRSIDKDNDKYKEKIVDPETGAIIHDCEEPLSLHRNRGSVKMNTEIGLRRMNEKTLK